MASTRRTGGSIASGQSKQEAGPVDGDRRTILRIARTGDTGGVPLVARFPEVPAGDYELHGWTEEEWAALPPGERPEGGYLFGSMWLLHVQVG